MNVTRRFAEHLHGLALRDHGPSARAAAVSLLLDGIAVGALGAAQTGPRLLADLAAGTGGTPVATLIGRPERVSGPEAARVNGAAMHVLDYEPMWNPANHALSTTLPAVLALAEMLGRRHASVADRPAVGGAAILTALAIGIETQARLRLASNQFEPGALVFHPPGVVGPLGSAVACGLLLGLEPEVLSQAIGIATSRAGTILANVGSMTKALHCGQAAAAGLESALLAARGFTADEDALSGPRGYGRTFLTSAFDPAPLTEVRERLHIEEPGPAFKLYPSQYGTHFVITAALEAGRARPAGARIERVRIISPAMPYVDRPAPPSGLAGKFSFQYVTAMALLDGEVTVKSFTDERRFRPDVVELLPKIVIETDAAREGRFDRMTVDVEVELADGSTASGRCDGPPGIWGRPADPARLVAKARDCLVPTFGEEPTARIMTDARTFADLTPAGVLEFMSRLAVDSTAEARTSAG
jgi:aconitate decarboxylase